MGRVRECVGDQEQFWRMAIETWQASGLSIRQFCKDEGLSEPALYLWRKKLTGVSSVHDEQDKPESSAFIEVSMPKSDHFAIELLLTSGNTMRIHPGIDSVTFGTVVSVLHQAGLC